MKKICLGIETTAHNFSFCLIKEPGTLIKENKTMYTTEQGGIIPSEEANHHKKVKDNLLKDLLKQTKIKPPSAPGWLRNGGPYSTDMKSLTTVKRCPHIMI